jgi:CheY-like chemotaxis protein
LNRVTPRNAEDLAEMVVDLLRCEFDRLAFSVDPDRAVSDFEAQRPQVLVLAFNELERAERYYLGLHRLSNAVTALPHHTVLLCHRNELRRAFDLCRKCYFDDYVLFWPPGVDASRLPMSVHLGLRRAAAWKPAQQQMAEQARRIGELESLLERRLREGAGQAEQALRTVVGAERGIEAALDGFSQRLLSGGAQALAEVRDRGGLLAEVARLKADHVGVALAGVTAALQAVPQWFGETGAVVRQQFDALRAPTPVAQRSILVIDDDTFQHRLLAHQLADPRFELSFAASAGEAWARLQGELPDVILMDIELPDASGVDLTRRLKGNPRLANIPVVMITGHSDKCTVVESLKAGAADFVVKPLDREILLGKLRGLLSVSD